jgi:outer membrane scaffolding protein for murein synthesis (MipA/OmpV family)
MRELARLAPAVAAAVLVAATAQAAEEEGEGLRQSAEAPGVVMPLRTAGRTWDASIGVVGSYAPEYAGAERSRFRVGPGFYVRWGRFSFATRSGFVTRSAEPGGRGGLRIDLSPSERWRVGLGLRYDFGRQETSSDALRGLGDVPSTLRVRLGTSYRLDDGWSVGGSLTVDAFGRGGGNQGDVSVGKAWVLTPATSLAAGLAVGFAGDRYMQSYFGVTPAQAARTGYPVFEPRSGLRDVSLSASGRTELAHPWAVFYGASASRLLGPAAASPLTRQPGSWGVNAGVVYRF